MPSTLQVDHLPVLVVTDGFLQFFWFFEARDDPSDAPTVNWLNGGPGSSSMYGILEENGPCYANPDSNSNHPSEWSWNNEGKQVRADPSCQTPTK